MLPPTPPLALSSAQRNLEARATAAVGRLDGATGLLPDPGLFLYMHVRKEAVLSSQIEGTQSSLSDLLLFEHQAAPGVPTQDVEEVSRCVRALNQGVVLLQTLPVSMRLLREVHSTLVTGARGADKGPGTVRTTQNWIGGSMPGNAAFVPPPAHLVPELLSNLEHFANEESLPPLLKAGIAHAQFETIHPFLDGNGRVGRLLITLLLIADKVLATPVLYLSLHFKEHRKEYYDLLQRTRTEGEWEGWIQFFLEGVLHVADVAIATIRRVVALFATDRARIEAHKTATPNTLRVFDHARQSALISIPETAKALHLSAPTVGTAVALLTELGILKELTGKQRDRRFLYNEYVLALDD